MRPINNIWQQSGDLKSHKTLRKREVRVEVLQTEGSPDYPKMGPGDQVTVPKDSTIRTKDDRLTFRNGGVVQDKQGDTGLTITYPSGRTMFAPGSIHGGKAGFCVSHNVKDPFGKTATWTQIFMGEGGALFTREEGEDEPSRVVTVTSDGKVSARGYDDRGRELSLTSRLEDGVVVLQSESHVEAIKPLVPLGWLFCEDGSQK